MLFDSLSVLVVRGGAVCLPTPPSWFSIPVILTWSEAGAQITIVFNTDTLGLFNDGGSGEDEDVRDGGAETIVGMRWDGKI